MPKPTGLLTLALPSMLALMLAACGDKPQVSVSGECKAFQRAAVEACGLTAEDQTVLDDYVETGVSACRWKRPQPRTPTCSALRQQIAEDRRNLELLRSGAAAPTTVAVPAAPPVKKHWWQRRKKSK